MPAPVWDEPAHQPLVPLGPPDPLALLDWIDDAGPIRAGSPNLPGFGPTNLASPPIQLDPSKPRLPPVRLPPLAKEEDLTAGVHRADAEKLLQSKDADRSGQATQAMEILLEVAPAQRAKVIDGLDDKAFDNLLDRVPEDQRERFAKLVESSNNPTRKLRLWAEFHKSKAGNDLHRYQGDFGDPDSDSRTDEQIEAQARYDRRSTGVEATNAEVERETKFLLAKAKAGKLTVADVDAMRERKDLELQIETEHNLNLTAETQPRPLPADTSEIDDTFESRVLWEKPELDQVRAVLSQLPDRHIHGPKTFATLQRIATRHIMDTKGGEFLGDHINITDRANNDEAFHSGEARSKVSDGLRSEYDDTIGSLEYVVTHEIGHDVQADNPKAFKKFKAAAGWQELDAAQLRKAGVSDRDIKDLDKRHDGVTDKAKDKDIEVNGKLYTPEGTGTYNQVDRTAIPTEVETGTRWKYAQTNAREHFAEVYAKAVHLPEKLYSDFVDRPAEAARDARAKVEEQSRAIAELKADPSTAAAEKVKTLTAEMETLKRSAESAEKAEKQRGDQFHIMRNDVFHTDKAVTAATARLRANNASDAAIRVFEARAERASTPQQIAALEQQVKR